MEKVAPTSTRFAALVIEILINLVGIDCFKYGHVDAKRCQRLAVFAIDNSRYGSGCLA